MKKILITGSSGFIGSNILTDLIDNNIIYLINRKKNYHTNNKKIKIINFKNHRELNNKLKNIKVNTIIHCATHYVKEHKFDDIQKMALANIEFGNVLLENLKSMKVKKFINFSTVWQNYNGTKDTPFNLYSTYKNAFEKITDFYKIKYNDINFYNLFISDTYGKNDKRKKLINYLAYNQSNNKKINIISKNLYINLLNVKDITSAIKIILYKKIKSGNYNLVNNSDFKISNIINEIKKKEIKSIKVKWLTKKKIRYKIYKFKKLPGWKTEFSTFTQLIKFIINPS